MKVIRIAILNLNWLLYDEQNPALYDSNGKRNKNMFFCLKYYGLLTQIK